MSSHKRMGWVVCFIGLFFIYSLNDSVGWLASIKHIDFQRNEVESISQKCDQQKTIEMDETNGTSFLCDQPNPWVECSQLPVLRKEPIVANNNLSDITILVFTAGIFHSTRARATFDTWGLRVPNLYYVSDSVDPYIGAERMAAFPEAGTNHVSNVWKSLAGIRWAVETKNETGWYLLVGCDTYVNIEFLMQKLSLLNSKEKIISGGELLSQSCWMGRVQYPSGGAGIILSRPVVVEMAKQLDTFWNSNLWNKIGELSGAGDLCITCWAYHLGAEWKQLTGMYSQPPQFYADGGNEKCLLNPLCPFYSPKVASLHYIKPPMMIHLDEYFLRQQIDLAYGDADRLYDLAHQLLTHHFKLLQHSHK